MVQRALRLSAVCLVSGLLVSCMTSGTTNGTAKPSDAGAALLDKTARDVANNYRSNCYDPVAKKKVPSELCQYQLFEKAERQWGPDFGKTELLQTANRFQGDQIEVAIMKILVYDKTAQRYVSSNKSTRYEIIQQLKDKYKLR